MFKDRLLYWWLLQKHRTRVECLGAAVEVPKELEEGNCMTTKNVAGSTNPKA